MLNPLDVLMPRRCVLCGARGTALCLGCLVDLPPAPDLAPPPGFSNFASLLSYEGNTRTLVASVKFRSRRDAIDLPARVLARLIDWSVDCVTWAPTSDARRRERGFDQAEVLARAIAVELGAPCLPSLSREPGSGHQTGRSRAERLEGASFRYAGGRHLSGRIESVLVVDDIRTTGATLCAAGDALIEAGIPLVSAATMAVTP